MQKRLKNVEEIYLCQGVTELERPWSSLNQCIFLYFKFSCNYFKAGPLLWRRNKATVSHAASLGSMADRADRLLTQRPEIFRS